MIEGLPVADGRQGDRGRICARVAFRAGLGLLAAGFPALLLVDDRAENAWTFFSCSAVVLGYTAIVVSILIRRD